MLDLSVILSAGLVATLAFAAAAAAAQHTRQPQLSAAAPDPEAVAATQALAAARGWGFLEPAAAAGGLPTLSVALRPLALDDVEVCISPAHRKPLAPMPPGARIKGGVLVRRCRVDVLEETVDGLLGWVRQRYQAVVAPWSALRSAPELSVQELRFSPEDGAVEMVIAARGGVVRLSRGGYRAPVLLQTKTAGLPLASLRRRPAGSRRGVRLADPILSSLLELETPTPAEAAALLSTEAARPVLVELFSRYPGASGGPSGIWLTSAAVPSREALVHQLTLLGELDAQLSA